MREGDRRGFLHRSHPAVRACLRHLGVPSSRLGAATLAVYRLAADEGVRVLRALPVIAAREAALGPGEAQPADPPASHLLREFVDGLGERERQIFVLAELGGAAPATLARMHGLSRARVDAGLARLRARFAAFVAAQGIAPAPVLAAAVRAERLDVADEARLWEALRDHLDEPAPARPLWPWLVAAAPALLAAAWILGAPASPRPGALATLRPALLRALAAAPPRAAAPEPAPPVPAPAELEPPVVVEAPSPAPAAAAPRAARSARVRRPRPDLEAREELARERDPGRVIVELEMIKAAKDALGRSPRQALAYLDQHARDFPRSQLADAREAVRVEALCRLGRVDEARAVAAAAGPTTAEALRRCDAR